MSFIEPEKFQNAQKSYLDLLQQVNSAVFSGVEQLSQLQFKTLRTASEEQFDSLGKLLSVRDPQSFVQLQSSLFQPTAQAERLSEFNRQVYEVLSGTQSEISRLAEQQVEAGARQVQDMVEVIAKNAPAAAEPAVTVLKSAVESAGTVYGNAQKAAKQAAEMAESGMAAATSAAGQASRNATQAAGAAQ